MSEQLRAIDRCSNSKDSIAVGRVGGVMDKIGCPEPQ